MPFTRFQLVVVAASFALAAVLTPLVRALARRRGMVAQPKTDRWHKKPTAMLGGVAIWLSVTTAYFAFVPHSIYGPVIIHASTFLFLVGLADDVIHTKPYQKLIGQIMGALQTAADQFGQSYQTIFVDGLKTEEERYNYFRAQADAVAQTITTLNDPTAISAAATQYNQLLMQAYNSLSAESRDAMRADILSTDKAVGDLVAERLNAVLSGINADNNASVPGSVGNAVEAAVTAGIDKLQAAVRDAVAALAAQQQSTATTDAENTAAFGGWVQKLPSSINVNVAIPSGSEVAFA